VFLVIIAYHSTQNGAKKPYKSPRFNFPLLLENVGSDNLWRLLFAKKIHLY